MSHASHKATQASGQRDDDLGSVLDMAYKLAHSFVQQAVSLDPAFGADDLVSDAMCHLTGQYELHDPARSKFSTFAYFLIRRRMLYRIKLIAVNTARQTGYAHRCVQEPVRDSFPADYEHEMGDLWEAAMDILEPDEQAIVCLKLRHNMVHREIARSLGISRTHAARVFSGAMAKLKANRRELCGVPW